VLVERPCIRLRLDLATSWNALVFAGLKTFDILTGALGNKSTHLPTTLLAILFMVSLQGSISGQIIDQSNQGEIGEKNSMLDPQPYRIPFASSSASFSV